MSERIEITPSQRRRCNRLIKRLCANYDDGNCLLLDHGGALCLPADHLLFTTCAGISGMQFYQPKRNCMRIFSNSALITAPNAGRLLCQTPTGRNTAHRAAKRCTAGRKTRAQGNAKRTIRTSKTPYFQGLLGAEPGCRKESYQPPRFRRSNCPNHKKRKDVVMKRKLVTVDAETLLAAPMSKIMFIVDGLIPQGVNVLSDAAKIGKSWLMLWLGLQVSQGFSVWGIPTMHCDVLYLCLEDTLKRIKDRLFDLTDDSTRSFHLAVTCGLIGNGLEEEIINFLEDFPKTKLVIIDTLQKVRDSKGSAGKTGMYGNDYDDISSIKRIADEHDIFIFLVHHLRKLKIRR